MKIGDKLNDLLVNYKPKYMLDWFMVSHGEDTSNKESKKPSKKRDSKSKKTKSIIKNYTSWKRGY